MKTNGKTQYSIFKRKAYLWITLVLFLASLTAHWVLGWNAYVNEQLEAGNVVVVNDYLVEMGRDTMENWQSEFLQLIWQVAGLAFLWYCGSPQSKEGDERKEEKLDFIIRKLDPDNAEKMLQSWEEKYPSK